MPKFDHEYYFIHLTDDDSLPRMTADEETGMRPYLSSRLPPGQAPLRFYNGAYGMQKRRRIRPIDPPPDLLFDGSDILVKRDVGQKLAEYDIPNLSMYPAIYVDHKDVWHEDYCFLTFIEEFDCWDRKHSDYDPEPNSLHGGYLVFTYSLDDELLDNTPLEQRRLFKMGKTLDGMIVVHQSIAHLFDGSGADLVPIADYGVNYPY